MPKFNDLTGQNIECFVVLSRAPSMGVHTMWNCRCKCGKEVAVRMQNLFNGNTKSCGCLKKEIQAKRQYRHGQNRTPTNIAWRSMKMRCRAKEGTKVYRNYVERGITVCDEWQEFETFYRDMGERPEGHSLDRIDGNKGYSKENCRWADITTQNNNTRQNVLLFFNGKTQTLVQWARELGINKSTLAKRIRRAGMSVENALTLPVKPRSH